MKSNFESTQIRLPPSLFDYIRKESARIGISQNSYMLILMEDGIRMRNAQIILQDRKLEYTDN